MRKSFWNDEKVAVLERMFPDSPLWDIAKVLGCSETTVGVKAKQMGLKKSPTYDLRRFCYRYVGRKTPLNI